MYLQHREYFLLMEQEQICLPLCADLFYLLWMWHLSRRARDPLLGFHCRSKGGDKSSLWAEVTKAEAWTRGQLVSAPRLYGTYKGKARERGHREQAKHLTSVNQYHLQTPRSQLLIYQE